MIIRIDYLIYVYMTLCLCMLGYNLFYLGKNKWRQKRTEKQIQDHGFHVCLAGEQDVKRILAVYYQQNVVTEHFDQVDGERWVTEHG